MGTTAFAMSGMMLAKVRATGLSGVISRQNRAIWINAGDRTNKMKQAATRALYDHWNELRGDRAAPERLEVEPAAIRSILNDTFILELDRGRSFGFRLAGSRLVDLFLCDLRGLSFLSLFRNEDAESVRALLDAVTDDPAPIVAGVRAAAPSREPVEFELLLLPMGRNGATGERVLGSLTPATHASWVGLVASDPMRLTSLRILHPASVPASGRYPLDPAFWATFPLADQPAGDNSPQRKGNLTLYSG